MTVLSFNLTLLSIFMATVIYVFAVWVIEKRKWPELPINSFFKYTNAFPVMQAIWVVIILNWLLQLCFILNDLFIYLQYGTTP